MNQFNHQFNNTIKIDVRDPNKLINRLEIFKALIATTNNPKIAEKIDYISQFEKRNLWFITFKKNYDIKSLLNEKLRLNNEEYIIQDTDDPYIYSTYKIAWLPHNTTFMQIMNFTKEISPFIELIDWEEECCFDKEIENIKSGIHILKTRVLRENKDKVKLKSGIYDFHFGFHNSIVKYSCKIFLTVSIDKPKCQLCKSDEHTKSACPTLIAPELMKLMEREKQLDIMSAQRRKTLPEQEMLSFKENSSEQIRISI